MYMRILPSVNAHIRKTKCAYTEESLHFGFRKCVFWLPYMHIYRRQNAHIRKRDLRNLSSVYAHFGFHKCAFWLPYMRIFSFRKCAYTKALLCICTFFLPHMRIYRSHNPHIQTLSSVYAHFGFCKCVYTEAKMHIYGSYMEALFHICAFWLPYMHIFSFSKCAYTEGKNGHIRKRAFVYAHFDFRISAFTKDKMRRYQSYLPYMCILSSVYVHFGFCKCAYTEALYTKERFRIYEFWLS
jgi:hypothetical protein